MSGLGLSKKETQKQKASTESGVTGSAYQHSMGGISPGGGGGTPPPGKGGPPDDKGDDGSDEEENEEEGTDEETVSVTSSSHVSAGRAGPLKWNGGKGNIKEGAGGPPEAPNDPSRGGSAGDGRRGPWGHQLARGIIQEMFSGIPVRDAETIAKARAELLAAERLKELCKQLGLAVLAELQTYPSPPEAPEYPPLPQPPRFPSRQEKVRKRLSHSHPWRRVLYPPNSTSNQM